jgi:hypothetical protein
MGGGAPTEFIVPASVHHAMLDSATLRHQGTDTVELVQFCFQSVAVARAMNWRRQVASD